MVHQKNQKKTNQKEENPVGGGRAAWKRPGSGLEARAKKGVRFRPRANGHKPIDVRAAHSLGAAKLRRCVGSL
jgi:hypothetical protein